MNYVHDVIVVGSGATGGWVALELSLSGLSVLVLESGKALHPKNDFSHSWHYGGQPTAEQIDNCNKAKLHQPIQSRHGAYNPTNFHLFADDFTDLYTYSPDSPFYWIRPNQEGGRTLLWRGQAWRVSNEQFEGRGESESYEGKWPLKYSDLEPYYTRVERFLKIRGTKERIGTVPDGLFLAPHPLANEEIRLKNIIESRWKGVNVIPVRSQVQGRGKMYRGFNQWPRLSSIGSTLSAAMETGRVSLINDAQVLQILVDRNGRKAYGVSYFDNKLNIFRYALSRIIVLCASTIETVRILLCSKSETHPNGLGNASGVLGYYFIDKIGSSITALAFQSRAAKKNRIDVLGPYGLYLPRVSDYFKQEKSQIRPYSIWIATESATPSISRLGARHQHVIVRMMAFGEMAPRRENRITLEPHLSNGSKRGIRHKGTFSYSSVFNAIVSPSITSRK